LPANVIVVVTPAIWSRGGRSLQASGASQSIIGASANASRRSILGCVWNSTEYLANETAVSGNVLGVVRVDVTHFVTGMADGLGVELCLPTGVATALLSKARSRRIRRVGAGLIARVVVRMRVILITVLVVPVVVAQRTVV